MLKQTISGGTPFFCSVDNEVAVLHRPSLAADDALVTRWDVVNGLKLETKSLEGTGRPIAFSRTGKYLLTRKDYPLEEAHPIGQFWDLKARTKSATIRVDSRNLISAAFDKKEKLIATGGSGGDIIVCEIPEGKLVNKFKTEVKPLKLPNGKLSNRTIDLSIHFVEFSADGRLVAAWDNSKYVRLWNVAKGEALATIPKVECQQCRFTPDGKYFVTMNLNVMDFRSIKDGTIIAKLGDDAKEKRFITQFMFSDDGKTAALASSSGTIHIWDIPEIK
jgi:WD40 repeat protein